MNYFSKAFNIIHKSFKGKTDLGGFPYVNHLLRVSSDLEGDLKVIALLHDLLEDCEEWTEEKLRQEFSNDIVDVVVTLTRLKRESYEDYIQRVSQDMRAIQVKIKDLEDNMNLTRIPTALSERDIERIKRYHKTWLYLVSIS